MERPHGTILIVGLSAMIIGCDGLHRSIYNLAPCPIQITYSTGNIIGNTVMVQPGEYAGSFGGMFARIEEVTIKEGSGQSRSYTESDLERLRPSGTREDHWLYLPSGLQFGVPPAHNATSVETSACPAQ